MKEEAAFGRPPMLSDAQSFGGGASAGCRQWRLGGAMGVQRCQSSGHGASMGHRRQCWGHLPTRGPLAAVLAAAPQRNHGGGFVGAAGGGSTPWVSGGVLATLGRWRSQTQQPTIDGGVEGRRWLRSRRLTGGNTTTSRGGQEREAAAQQEVKTEGQTAIMTARLLVGMMASANQNNSTWLSSHPLILLQACLP